MLSKDDKVYWRKRGANFIRSVLKGHNTLLKQSVLLGFADMENYLPARVAARHYWKIGVAQEMKRNKLPFRRR